MKSRRTTLPRMTQVEVRPQGALFSGRASAVQNNNGGNMIAPEFSRELKTEDPPPNRMISWQLNELCNFRCPYCFCGEEKLSREHPACGKYSPEHIADCFDRTGKTWQVHMSGGEPFLYPRFVELCMALTRSHYISMNTNLSTANANDFACKVPEVLSIVVYGSSFRRRLGGLGFRR